LQRALFEGFQGVRFLKNKNAVLPPGKKPSIEQLLNHKMLWFKFSAPRHDVVLLASSRTLGVVHLLMPPFLAACLRQTWSSS